MAKTSASGAGDSGFESRADLTWATHMNRQDMELKHGCLFFSLQGNLYNLVLFCLV